MALCDKAKGLFNAGNVFLTDLKDKPAVQDQLVKKIRKLVQ